MEPNNYQTEEVEIDLWALFGAIRDKLLVIFLTALSGAIIAYLVSSLLITATYDSTTKIYVLNKQDNNASTITYSDLQSSTQLTKDYMELVTTRPVLEEVISSLGLADTTYRDLAEMIKVSTATDGRIISITATDEDPRQAKAIADEVRNSVSAQIMKVMDVEAVNVVEEANLPDQQARPSNLRNTAIGGFLGLFLAVAVVVILAILDDRVKSAEDVEHYLGMSVLGTIPLEEGQQKKTMKKKMSKSKKKSSSTIKKN